MSAVKGVPGAVAHRLPDGVYAITDLEGNYLGDVRRGESCYWGRSGLADITVWIVPDGRDFDKRSDAIRELMKTVGAW